jgi:broad specificity phosphatase PhoE
MIPNLDVLARSIEENSPFAFSSVRWLVLVRHGETDCNVARRIAGQMPYPYGARLTKSGRKCAKRAGTQIQLLEKCLGFHGVAVSTCERAIETLDLCTEGLVLPPRVELDGLRERGMGGAILLPKDNFPRLFSDPDAMPPRDGNVNDGKPETFRSFVSRVDECYENDIVPMLTVGNVLLVSHQYVTAAIQKNLYGLSLRETMVLGHQIPNSAPLVLGLDPVTLMPIMGGLCVL